MIDKAIILYLTEHVGRVFITLLECVTLSPGDADNGGLPRCSDVDAGALFKVENTLSAAMVAVAKAHTSGQRLWLVFPKLIRHPAGMSQAMTFCSHVIRPR